jgi:predicted permease
MQDHGGSTPFSFPLIEAVWGPQAVSLALFLDLPNAFVLFCVNFMLAAYLAPKTDLPGTSIPANQIQPADRRNAARLTSRKRPNPANVDGTVATGDRYSVGREGQEAQEDEAEAEEEEGGSGETVGLICSPHVQAWAASVQRIDVKVILRNFFKNVPLVCFFIAIAMNVSGLHFPEDVLQYMDVLSRCSSTMLLLMTGEWALHTAEYTLH